MVGVTRPTLGWVYSVNEYHRNMRFQNFGIPFRSFRRCDFKVSEYHFEALGYLPGGKSGLQEVWWGKSWLPGGLVSLIGRRDVLGGDLRERPAKSREAKSGFGLRGSTCLGGLSGKNVAKGLGLEGGSGAEQEDSRPLFRHLFQTPELLHTARHASDPLVPRGRRILLYLTGGCCVSFPQFGGSAHG